MKTSRQCVTIPADKRPTFVSRNSLGVVTFRNPDGIYPRFFRIAPMSFFNFSKPSIKKVY